MASHANLTACWSGSEIEVSFTANAIKADYGVPGSPVWYEPQDIEINELTIMGTPVDVSTLPDAVKSNIFELSHELEWSPA